MLRRLARLVQRVAGAQADARQAQRRALTMQEALDISLRHGYAAVDWSCV